MALNGQHEQIPITDLRTYHTNPKHGDVNTIANSLRVNGQYRPIVVNKGTHTGRYLEVLAGNHTLKAFRLNAERNPHDPQWAEIDCWVIDVDDDQAARIVLADNRTADLGTYDNDTLLELIGSLDDTIGLDGTGYTEDYIDCLLGANELETLPEEGDADVTDEPMSYSIVVECQSEADQSRLLERFIQEGLECRAIM